MCRRHGLHVVDFARGRGAPVVGVPVPRGDSRLGPTRAHGQGWSHARKGRGHTSAPAQDRQEQDPQEKVVSRKSICPHPGPVWGRGGAGRSGPSRMMVHIRHIRAQRNPVPCHVCHFTSIPAWQVVPRYAGRVRSRRDHLPSGPDPRCPPAGSGHAVPQPRSNAFPLRCPDGLRGVPPAGMAWTPTSGFAAPASTTSRT